MKKFSSFLIALMVIAVNIYAQIPNNGFESWTMVGNYQDPTFWGSANTYSSGPFYAITKSTDHYPPSVGSYSARIENNIALNPNYSARGALFTGPPPPTADFKIIGHPTSLTGYYKFAPQNGDTMLIMVQLFSGGSSIAYGQFASTAATPNWTTFNVPISTYSVADSGSIFLASYYANGFNYIPHGNSVLYVDNLNFDHLVTSVSDLVSRGSLFSFYPNPSNDMIRISINRRNNSEMIVNIYNLIGTLVKTETMKQTDLEMMVDELKNGIYILEVKTFEGIEKQRLIIQR